VTSSGTYGFQPNVGETVLYAYSRCGIRRTELVQEHMADARMATNMVLADFSNRGVNLWKVNLVTIPLIQGQATYSLDPSAVVMLDTYVTVNSGGQNVDRIILPISRTEYASYPEKQQQGFPTVVWMDRLLSPTFTLWLVPNGEQVSVSTYVLTQIQDANYTNGQTLDLPYLWLKAFSDALSVELATIWAPERLSFLVPMADKSYQIAADQNIETAQQYISPQIAQYYRN
jgi:hypothetical protein